MTRRIRVLLVDDEPPARRRLRRCLSTEPDIEVVAECGMVADAARILNADPDDPTDGVDAVFLDVRMPGSDGFELVRGSGSNAEGAEPAVVFVSAYPEHAVEAFDVRAVDYLLKPFTAERLAESVDRIREHLSGRSRQRSVAADPSLVADRLPVDVGGRIRLVEVDRIEYVRAEGNYLRIHTRTGSHLVRGTLTGLERRLPPDRFCRIHRSLIVRLTGVREVEVLEHGELGLLLGNGVTLISGRTYRDRVRAALGLSFDGSPNP